MEYSYAFLILLLPFLSFLLIGLAGMKMKKPVAGLIGTLVIGSVFAMSVFTAYEYFFAVGRDAATGLYPTVTVFNLTWLKFTELLTFNIGFRLTPISVMMLIVITTVSFMVHIYSFGYMAERDENYKKEEYEPGFQRFYAYLSLFTMSMLGLVVATNIFQMYLFWELVGVCSYLLIGFYYPKHAAVHASKKAFIVTRFADLFFLIGILFYSFYVGTFNYDLSATPELQSNLAGAAWVLPMALFLMFIGGAGKSAMFPLHIWLPDAMEGPTPVSALIHAATMVVAGVYQVASLFPIWVEYAPNQLHWVAYIAAFTAFYAAAVACCQSDIKRGLAFSTISQIAYMLVALGVCTAMEGEGGVGYMASMFHLFTHAMFKALLFLCSGAIIVIIGSNFKEYMGGLHKYMPITNICFLIGTIAISGFFPLAGFFSKDEIVDACFHFSPFMGYFMTLVSGMTAFYMFRLYYVIFWGNSYYEADPEHRRKPAEVPFVMWGPLVFLAVVSCFAGWIPFGHFVSADGHAEDIALQSLHFGPTAWMSLCVAFVGFGLATWMYAKGTNPLPDMLQRRMPRLHKAALNRFYIDDAWQFFTHKIVFGLFSKPIAWFDRRVIDGTFNFMAWGAQEAGETIRPWQSGDVRSYAVWFLTGTVALTLILLAIAL
ncbi:NADH-quinone oxidoreductase subunit L [Prevotella sp. A2931]|uniref:NADH-quinone oxidoreductase subunit L n=1 Tax=Prevotella illustrans TaxID=2800387 RepID=A0ABS3M568_9BACT|nr:MULTISPECIES: NADH-quinone oxidoreductase subunit L [Prevotella]MBO1363323.1 NADH-quinone oxidoreductase subunit L [Prevotella illustrans]PTL25809.1 NADH-quinone oxidoreductase subunit L [Prevotella sp. oral taxon 820]